MNAFALCHTRIPEFFAPKSTSFFHAPCARAFQPSPRGSCVALWSRSACFWSPVQAGSAQHSLSSAVAEASVPKADRVVGPHYPLKVADVQRGCRSVGEARRLSTPVCPSPPRGGSSSATRVQLVGRVWGCAFCVCGGRVVPTQPHCLERPLHACSSLFPSDPGSHGPDPSFPGCHLVGVRHHGAFGLCSFSLWFFSGVSDSRPEGWLLPVRFLCCLSSSFLVVVIPVPEEPALAVAAV